MIKLLTSICPILVAERARGLIVSSLLLSLSEAQPAEKQSIAQSKINTITGHLLVLRSLDLDFRTPSPEAADRAHQDLEVSGEFGTSPSPLTLQLFCLP